MENSIRTPGPRGRPAPLYGTQVQQLKYQKTNITNEYLFPSIIQVECSTMQFTAIVLNNKKVIET